MKARPALAAGAADPKADEAEELRQLLALSPADLEFLERVRGDAHRLALAVQLVWTRTERALVTDLSSLPPPVIATVAAQLGVDPEVLGAHRERRPSSHRRIAWRRWYSRRSRLTVAWSTSA